MFRSIFVLLMDDLCDVMTIFVVYLLLLSVLLTAVYSINGKVTGERIWKESRHHCCIFIQRQGKHGSSRWHSRCAGRHTDSIKE